MGCLVVRTLLIIWRLSKSITKHHGFSKLLDFQIALFKKPKLAPVQERKLIDCHRLCAKCGDGGNGCFSINRY
ncbi:hypothetical protein HanIR_Chr13g0655181 [Helianthus annuus]|nr:hypothetical protein HanIR_Chr13g0655181 [Helianthus annuus]